MIRFTKATKLFLHGYEHILAFRIQSFVPSPGIQLGRIVLLIILVERYKVPFEFEKLVLKPEQYSGA